MISTRTLTNINAGNTFDPETTSDLIPAAGGVSDLGTSAKPFRTVYSNQSVIKETLRVVDPMIDLSDGVDAKDLVAGFIVPADGKYSGLVKLAGTSNQWNIIGNSLDPSVAATATNGSLQVSSLKLCATSDPDTSNVSVQKGTGAGNLIINFETPTFIGTNTITLPLTSANEEFVVTNVDNKNLGSKKFNTINIISTVLEENPIKITGWNKQPITIHAGPIGSERKYTLPEAGANADFVMNAGDSTIGGAKTFSSGITLPTTGGTATSLTAYSEFTHTCNWSGPIPSTAGNILVTVIGRLVTLYIPATVVAGNSTAAVITGSAALPAWIWPIHELQSPAIVVNANSTILGAARITTAGVVQFSAGPFSSSNFSSTTASVGFNGTTLTYTRV